MNEQLVGWCKEYLADLHSTLWGQAYDLINGDLEEAAEWLAETIKAVREVSER